MKETGTTAQTGVEEKNSKIAAKLSSRQQVMAFGFPFFR